MMDLAIFDVTSRLVEHDGGADPLLHHEEAAVISLRNGSNRQVGAPGHLQEYRGARRLAVAVGQYFGTLAIHISSNSCR